MLFLGDPIRMAEARVKKNSSSLQRALQLRSSLLSLLPTLPVRPLLTNSSFFFIEVSYTQASVIINHIVEENYGLDLVAV